MHGFVLLNKPTGLSSFGAVAQVRRCVGEKRAGHTGTLDPFAEGVLPILLGRATRLSSYLMQQNKRYRAEVTLGVVTDTQDITGTVLQQNAVSVSEQELREVAEQFVGDLMQVPPMFSAVHVDGKRLYELAREGKQIEREARPITVHELDIVSFDGTKFVMDVACSKGTYIRTLAHDIGQALGCGAMVSQLKRTENAGFTIDQCATLEQLRENPTTYTLPTEHLLMHYPRVDITHKQAVRVQNGGELSLDRCDADAIDGQLYRICYNDQLVALGQVNCEKNALTVKCQLCEDTL